LTGRRPFEAVRLQRYFQSGTNSASSGSSLFIGAASIVTAREKLSLDVIHQYKLSFHCIEFMKTILEPNVSTDADNIQTDCNQILLF
jgi:hypothetical protein